ncbi:MAG: hypothetical protein LC798_15585 [Chloroflexi bacterium]|nr:hypothetical protein [Chloroflexota bacterium]
MTPAPGSTVETVTAPPSSGAPVDTGTAFIAMPTEKGSLGPTLVRSVDEAAIFGADISYSSAKTNLEAFFRNGGKRAYVSRIVGPAPVAASKILNSTGPVVSVKFTAASVGSWANTLRLEVIAGTGSSIIIVLSDSALITAANPTGEIARSGELADKAAVIAYTGFSKYGSFASAGGGGTPMVSAASTLNGGTDDNAAITDTQRAEALARFDRGFGPGQELLPGDTRSAAAAMLGASAAAHDRMALWDAPDSATAGTVAAAALTVRSDPNAQSVIAVAPWAQVPAAVYGATVRDVPYSLIQAGVIARQDDETGNPNAPAAGDAGIATWITGVKAAWSDVDRATLNDAGVNVALDLYDNGVIRMYGNRTLVEPTTGRLYLQASNVRFDMAVKAKGRAIADRFVLRQVDGKGRVAAQYASRLAAMLQEYRNDEALFPLLDPATGQELDPGFDVDAGPLVNTPETLAAFQLIAIVRARRSPAAEMVTLRIVNLLPTEAF